VTKGIWPVAIVFLPFFIFFTALAFPWSKDQPTEIWLASRIRFFLVPHKRIWNQTGMKDLVTITVPKREVHVYSDGLSQDQVRSRFSALATVVDTRGWAVKNVMPAGAPAMPFAPRPTIAPSDRLVTAAPDITLNERTTLVESTQDIMDVQKSPVAQQFNTLIDQSTEKHRQETLAMIQQARHHTEIQATGPTLPPVQVAQGQTKNTLGVSAKDLWFLKEPEKVKEPTLAAFQETATVLPGQTSTAPMGMGMPVTAVAKEDEEKLLDHVKKKKQREREQRRRGHEKVLRPLAEIEEEEKQKALEQAEAAAVAAQTQAANDDATQSQTTSVTPVDPAILNLANNDDLNVETLARQAKRDKPEDPTEVIITLR
jgi:hypothetical protein